MLPRYGMWRGCGVRLLRRGGSCPGRGVRCQPRCLGRRCQLQCLGRERCAAVRQWAMIWLWRSDPSLRCCSGLCVARRATRLGLRRWILRRVLRIQIGRGILAFVRLRRLCSMQCVSVLPWLV